MITVSGFSKTFSMTGWRLGTLVANPTIAKAVANLQSQTASNATTFAQYGALAAVQNWDQAMQAVQDMLVHFDRRRLLLLDGLNAIPGIECLRSQGAFYLFPKGVLLRSILRGIFSKAFGAGKSGSCFRACIWGRWIHSFELCNFG